MTNATCFGLVVAALFGRAGVPRAGVEGASMGVRCSARPLGVSAQPNKLASKRPESCPGPPVPSVALFPIILPGASNNGHKSGAAGEATSHFSRKRMRGSYA